MESKAKKSRGQIKSQARLNELIQYARFLQIEVRSEKLLREVGYRVTSGSCRLKERNIIFLDRDLSVGDQVDILAGEIRRSLPDPGAVPPELRDIL